MGIYLCIIFYGTSKLFIYLFLSERVYTVWRFGPHSQRLRCKAYLGCLVVLFGYCVVIGVLFYGQVSYFGGDRGMCYIGLKRSASITLLAYDFFVNAVLTGLFLWPVMYSSFRNNRMKRLGVRTLWSAFIALTTSCVNILILTLMDGRQLGWVCLGSCGTDVIVNALVIYWVTSKYPDNHDTRPSAPDVILSPNPEDPEPASTEPQRNPKVTFKLGSSRQDSPTGTTTMEIKVTTERIEEHSEPSINSSEYELQKVHSINSNEVRKEHSPNHHKRASLPIMPQGHSLLSLSSNL